MSFILLLLTGFAAGIFGGMGMGGGTVLIPALTLILGVEQRLAQATNVIAFLPMAALVLPRHKKNGLLRTDGVLALIIPALISTAIFSLIMAVFPTDALRKAFGVFLVVLAVKQAFVIKSKFKQNRPKF
ncbi:MAG: TSUP family transporter [Candidatus Coproplasma sp.]